ncbi:uncharacterized protein CIMG_08710 [Coccidioides immitis RS]|uniref:Uncharacterized protein n=4 Tax=Coccidioides immitis TaxID=5501 RepID=A0A0E1RX22_COCIM|nr:uncharacterized protein CIMG_08710 [Coccidioides immitis RS]EAS29964.1 hypothetical protein CIMG_08710 [Coccidioides immitis RS]KMP06951.1 hypothetical protein CIRG_06632 [Coccidioides immitis RMSCC 2394]KMU75162.1 hypothetical protein CISG_04110 [Coccidioides immitis RMSCC 3703]KMU92652.1 hypothetical protein CIHG_10462 [Coccidioides immitis H538.4]
MLRFSPVHHTENKNVKKRDNVSGRKRSGIQLRALVDSHRIAKSEVHDAVHADLMTGWNRLFLSGPVFAAQAINDAALYRMIAQVGSAIFAPGFDEVTRATQTLRLQARC